jgi:preprotein translocase subunit SecA
MSKTTNNYMDKTVSTQKVASVTAKKPSTLEKNRGIITKTFDAIMGERRELGKYWAIVKKIEALEPEIQKLTDKKLREKTTEFRKQFEGLEGKAIQKKLDAILPEAFAVVREAAIRTLGQRHYAVQLIGGMVLNDGRISEMKTGEGKTLVSTLSAYLNALPAQSQVHVITVNDYLARRDASWMGRVFDFLGLSIGIIQNQASFRFKLGAQADEIAEKKRSMGQVDSFEDGEMDSRTVLDVENLVSCSRLEAYFDDATKTPVDIVYGVNSEFGFDYLRDNMAQTIEEIVQKSGHTVAIIDEVDSILIDEARTPLIISSQDKDSSARYSQFAQMVRKLNPDLHYEVDEKRRTVTLTDLGIDKIEGLIGVKHLYSDAENVVLVHHLDQALKAQAVFKREKDYVVRDGEIIIVDENTGRMMFGRRYNQGLHQAIEAKEGVKVQAESKTVATITFQNYFRMYKKLSGMTGTAATEAEELFKIYKLLVVTIPTNRPNVRQDLVDKIFKTEDGKFRAIARDIKAAHESGQPVLIGTTSIEKNLLLSRYLDDLKVPHEVLNAKNHEQEARIVSQAGELGAVTLATNIAGRGVDIKLGGEIPEDKAKYDEWLKKHEQVKELGGLLVVGTERHESRRIDNQLRGRAGRQGDNGRSQFYISLEDYILRVFGGDRISYYNILPIADDEAIQNKILSKLIEEAQKKIEGQNYDIRKHVTEYDDIINRQRSVIYARRRQVLYNEGFDAESEITNIFQKISNRIVEPLPRKIKPKTLEYWQFMGDVSKNINNITSMEKYDKEGVGKLYQTHKNNTKKIASQLAQDFNTNLKKNWNIYTPQDRNAIARFTFLRAIDILWTEHLVTIDHLNDSVRLRGYSQKDPLVEFKQDGMGIFMNLLEEIDSEISQTVFKVKPNLIPSSMLQQSQ